MANPSKATYVFLHLSDIHFGQEDGGSIPFYDDVRRELLSDVVIVSKEVGPPDRVLVTGDIAYRGITEEFAVAGLWLDALCAAVGCPKESVFLVPGNHDVNRKKAEGAVKQWHDQIRNSVTERLDAHLADFYEDRNAADILLRKLESYRSFAERYGCAFASCQSPSIHTHLTKPGLRGIRLWGLNTVLVSDKDDGREKLVLGRAQYIFSRDPSFEDVVLLHHPLHWLKDERAARDFLHSRARLLLSGHEHDLDLEKRTSLNDFERLEVRAGAVNPPGASEFEEYRYHWLVISFEEGASPAMIVRAFPRVWSRKGTKFAADKNRIGDAEWKEFRLALSPKAPTAPEAAPTFTAVSPDPEAAGRSTRLDSAEDPRLKRLRFLYWKELDRRQRLTVMVALGILPNVEDELALSIERQAFEAASRQGKLQSLWDAIMNVVPEGSRESNPFNPGE